MHFRVPFLGTASETIPTHSADLSCISCPNHIAPEITAFTLAVNSCYKLSLYTLWLITAAALCERHCVVCAEMAPPVPGSMPSDGRGPQSPASHLHHLLCTHSVISIAAFAANWRASCAQNSWLLVLAAGALPCNACTHVSCPHRRNVSR